jgi:type IV pilus assembly protein PilN
MIRINLLTAERATAGPSRFEGLSAHRVHLLGVACLGLTAAGLGWWHLDTQRQIAQVEVAVQQATAERERLKAVLEQITQFEEQRTQLQQRVALIEQLRKGQRSPVTLLDQVSRGVPDRLWLTELKQVGADVTLEGRTTTLTALSDFIGNLEESGAFTRPVEILNSEVDNARDSDIVKFQVKATFPLGAIETTSAAPATRPAGPDPR